MRRLSGRKGAGPWLRALLCLLCLLPQPLAAATLTFLPASGEVLESSEADQPWHPASLTKLMTAYLVFQELAAGRMTLDQELTVSAKASTMPTTALGLAEGRAISVEEALLGLILRSGNDTAVVLAEAVAGSEADFALRMNEAAAALDMTSTFYANASGLPDDRQVTTARDLALLTAALLTEFPQYYELFGRQGFSFAGDWRPNINGILGSLKGADGLKTGFTGKSGYNLVVSAEREGQRVVAVILGERSPGERSAVGRALVEGAFETLADGERSLGPALEPLDSALVDTAVRPPAVLVENECGYGVAARLPGWGVVLGAQRSRARALEVAESAKERIAALAEGGTTAVPARRGTRFHALVVGLSRSEAQRGCQAIRNGGGFCLVVNNAVLNNPRAVWR